MTKSAGQQKHLPSRAGRFACCRLREAKPYSVPRLSAVSRHAIDLIGECHGFEYYLIVKDLSWLVYETHHDVVCAVGEAVEQRLLCYAT